MGGTLVIPRIFNPTVGDQPFADLDLDFSTIAAYINLREGDVGLLANRAAAGNKGHFFLATDVNGGTLYLDDGAAWNQVAPSVNQQAPSNVTSILASYAIATP